MSKSQLNDEARAFFAALDRVVYGNPFSEERAAVIQRLLPGEDTAHLMQDREALARLVEPRLQPFDDPATLRRLSDADRRLVESGFLYVCYHHHVPPIDAIIKRQVKHGESAPVDELAGSVIRELVGHGFAEDAAARYFAFFYQLRRAYRFILHSLAGECPSMHRLRRALWDNVLTHDMRGFESGLWNRMEDFSTLLLGETGTGKGAAAAAIGRSQFIPYVPETRRFAANFTDGFIAINLSQFPETLIESELFGHRKGAFTGAIDHHEGVFQRCSAHGALFLDEIGEVSIPVQIKLLQVLQDRVFTPLGSHERRRFAGRVVAATNRPLDELRRKGRFRDDFYYRLCSDVIRVPTLRERIDESARELELLVRLLVARIVGTENEELATQAIEVLGRDVPPDYRWPGNVRELEQAVRRVLLTGRCADGLGGLAGTAQGEAERLATLLEAGRLSAQELLGRYCALLHRRFGTYAEVAERTGLDRRTARKYVVEYAGAAKS
jgi:sigma-54 specific flagellar transcriptional regulator A